MTELRGALEDAISGRGRMFLIGGEQGIGKTRLADELAIDAERRGMRVLWGRCWEGGGAPIYWPWVQVIRACAIDVARLSELLRSAPPYAAYDIAQLIPEYREAAREDVEFQATRLPGPEQARFRLFDSLTTLLRSVASATPLMIVFDDLHAADQPSMLALNFFARELRGIRVLVLGTYRSDEMSRSAELSKQFGELTREAHHIPLGGLNETDVAHMLVNAIGPQPGGKLLSAVFRATDGNPFYVEGVVRLVAAQGKQQLERGGLTGFNIPEGIRESVRRRLAGLSSNANSLLAWAATIGDEFDVRVIRSAIELPVEVVLELMDEVRKAGIVTEHGGRHRFSHGIIRETVYAGLGASNRVSMHRKVAEILEALYVNDIDSHLAELAHHFLQAAETGATEKALSYSRRAAELASSRFAFEEAARLYAVALEALELHNPRDRIQRCDLLIALAEAQEWTGANGEARENLKRAVELAGKLGAPERLGRAALDFGLTQSDTHLVDTEAVDLLERALDGIGHHDSALKCKLMAQLAVELYISNERHRRSDLIEAAVAMARRLSDSNALLFALSAKRRTLWEPENVEERLAVADEAVELAQRIGDLEAALVAHRLRIIDLVEFGDIAAADAGIAVFSQLAEKVGHRYHLWEVAAVKAMRALLEGRYQDAEIKAKLALEIGQRLGSSDAIDSFVVQLSVIYREQGSIGDLESSFKTNVDRNPSTPIFRCGLAYLYMEAGRETEARREFEYLSKGSFVDLPRFGTEWLAVLSLLGGVCSYLGDRRRAQMLYPLLLPFAARYITIYHIVSFGSVSHFLGLIAATMDRFDLAEAHFEDALRMNAGIGAKPWLADTQCEYAAMLLNRNGRGDRGRVSELLGSAFETAQSIGSKRLVARIEELRARNESAAITVSQTAMSVRSDTASPVSSGAPVRADAATTPTASQAFFREGDYWTIAYQGKVIRLKQMRGLSLMAHLLRYPGQEFHVLGLAALGEQPGVSRGFEPTGVRADINRRQDQEAAEVGFGDAGEMLDSEAKDSYRRRLAELREQFAEAQEFGDTDRVALIQNEIDALARELSRAIGFRGRDRRAASATERARVNVTRAIKAAVERITTGNPALGKHLAAAIKTGAFCSYLPAANVETVWQL